MASLVYWERQGRGRYCGLHAVNSLLQGPYFDAADFAAVAHELDRKEQLLLSEDPDNDLTKKKFVSQNISNDGFFSVGVIEGALNSCGVACIPASKSAVASALTDPTAEEAFLCHLNDHWLAIRKVDTMWYNLDSLKNAPTRISEFFLGAFLRSLADSGYSLFVVRPLVSHGQSLSGTDVRNGIREWASSAIPPPGGFAALYLPPPPPHRKPSHNQLYYKPSDIAAMQKDDTTVTKQNGKSEEAYTFPTTGGRRLDGSVPNWSDAPQREINPSSGDAEIDAALRLSLIDFIQSLPQPPSEPPCEANNEALYTIQVRLPSGRRHSRRFLPTSPLKHLFWWMEGEVSLNALLSSSSSTSSGPMLCQAPSYCLVSSIGCRKLTMTKAGPIIRVATADAAVEDAAEIALADLPLDCNSTFNTQIAASS